MKYINCEYGFEGRPPFFNGYFEQKSTGPKPTSFVYPKNGTVGFGLSPETPNGILVAGKLGSMWLVKISYQKMGIGKWIDTEDFKKNPGNFFASGKGGRFSYFNHGEISATIVRYSDTKVVLNVSGMSKVRVRLTFCPIVPGDCEFPKIDGENVYGESNGRAIIPGTTKLNDYDMEIHDRYVVEFDEKDAEKEYFFAHSYTTPTLFTRVDSKKVVQEFFLDKKNTGFTLFMSIGAKDESYPDIAEINHGVSTEELIYTAEKVMGSGPLGESVADVVSRCNMCKIYDPYRMSCFLVENKSNFKKHFAYDPTDMAVGALVYALSGEYAEAIRQLEPCATDSVFGALAAWIIYCRTRNAKVIDLMLSKFTLDADVTSELVVADRLTMREIAYKQNGSPLKDIANEPVYSLDMSCYKLLFLDVMSRMACIASHNSANMLSEAKAELKKNITTKLFNEKLGLFMDRYVSGEFVGVYTANTFLPLVAGAIDDVNMLEKLLLNLKDPERFGGALGITTLPKSHALFGKETKDHDPLKKGYRGMISPKLNFLIYLGLKRYGVNAIATDLCLTSVRLYKQYLNKNNITPNFYPENKHQEGGHTVSNSLSGNLMGIMGMMEMLDVEYFREDLRPAISFGSLASGDNRLANVDLWGRSFNVTIGDETILLINGKEAFKGSGKKFIVRGFTESNRGVEFVILAAGDITVEISLPIFAVGEKENKVVFNVEKGKTKVLISKKCQVQTLRLN